jgi:hypothetical protein
MKPKSYQITVPVTLIVVMLTFLSVFIFGNANHSFAASDTKKSSAVTKTSAVDQTEALIKQLRVKLKFTEAQEELWKNLTQVMRENAKDMDSIIMDRSENTNTMNAVENLKFHSEISEAHLNHMKKFIPPFEALYNSMSDKQKKITDTIIRKKENEKLKK